MNDKMNVESFNLDHTKVKAPYVRLVDVSPMGHHSARMVVAMDERLALEDAPCADPLPN